MSLKLSQEEKYGIMALIDLSQAGQSARVKNIAERQNIPKRFLEQIFNRFRQADIVVGKRGPAGGYTLAKPADEIKLNTIMAALKPTSKEKPAINNGLSTTISNVWSEVEEKFNQTLETISLENLRDLADSQTTEETTTDFNTESLNIG